MMTEEDIRTELGWNDDMIYSLLQTPDSRHARRNKHTADTHMGFTIANDCWPSLNRQKAEPRKTGGMRRYALTGQTQAGRNDSAI
jgi:hypothetical protein